MPEQAKHPNVLVIMTDQHRHDLMTCAGRELVPTPNIDRIAGQGVRFTNAYCPYPVCVASRMAMLTGLYAHSTGAINNTDRLDWRYRTIAHHFGDNGYLTGLIGKMHFNDAMKHGFDYYLSINDWLMYLGPKVRHFADEIANHPMGPRFFETVDDDGAGMPDVGGLWDGPSPWVGNVQRYPFTNMASQLEADDHLDMFIARETVKFIRSHRREAPFLLYASFMKPHTPFYAPREYAERYPIADTELPEAGDVSGYPEHLQRRMVSMSQADEWRRRAHVAGYLGNLAFADTCVGVVLDALDELGLWEDTIVVYTSDHGEMGGDHGLLQKFCLFEPSVRVPLIVAHSPSLPAASVSEALIEQIGLYPTLVDLAGLPEPGPPPRVAFPGAADALDGVSFSGCVRQPMATGPDAAFSEYNLRGRPCQYMVRTAQYKYVYNEGSTHELYDLGEDPGEFRNIWAADGDSSTAREHRERLFEWFDPATNRFRAV